MPQPYSEMEESRSVTPWVNRLYFKSPRASSFLGLRLVKARHKNLVSLLSWVKPDSMVGSGWYAEPIPVKCPLLDLGNGSPPVLCFDSSPPRCCIYVSVNWVSIGSGSGLSPVRCEAITWTNVVSLSFELLGTNFSEIWWKTQNFSFMKMHLKM